MTRTRRRTLPWLSLPALAAALLAQAGCGGTIRIPGQWLAVSRPADGRLDDFSRSLTSHLFENGMMVGIGNDADSLYVFFTPDMRRGRMRTDGARLTVWLDPRGGKARRLGLEYLSATQRPGRTPETRTQDGEAGSAAQGAPPPGDRPERDHAAPQHHDFLKIIDRASGRETFIAGDGAQGPALRLDSGWGDYTYQMRIPLRPAGDWPGLDVKAGQVLSVGLVWEIEKRREPRGRGMEMPRGAPGGGGPAGGGPRGMGPGDGGMGPERMPGSAPPVKRRAWVRTVIAAR